MLARWHPSSIAVSSALLFHPDGARGLDDLGARPSGAPGLSQPRTQSESKPSWFGESVGHYENGELVIDTIGFIEHPYSFVDNFTTPHTKDLHVVERWKISNDGNALEATVTVDDPGAFKAPWSGMIRWQKVNRPITEWACAENNLGYEQAFELQEYPMPVANSPGF